MVFTSPLRWLRKWSFKSENSQRVHPRRRPHGALTLETLEDRTLLSVNFPLNTSSWTALGPAPITNGVAPGEPVSGRIAGIATDPVAAGTYYIAAAGGGVWKTTNSGVSWTPLTDAQQTLSMGAIAVAPNNANVIYAGTGEANNSGDSNYGVGILKSTDVGATWSLKTDGGKFFGLTTSKIVVDPTNASIVYAAMSDVGANQAFISGTGVYKSTDGGTTWTNTTSSIPSITTTNEFSDVAIDPNNAQTLYAAVGDFQGSTANGVYKSTNGGTTWTLLGGGLPTPGGSLGRISIAVAPSNSQVVYVSIENPFTSGLLRVLRSDNGGGSWNTLTTTPNYMGGQGWYDQALAVSPTNSSNVFAAGVVNYNTDSIAVIESTDAGQNWTSIAGSNLHGTRPTEPHTDHHALTFTSGGKLLDGNDGGIWRLDNATVGSIAWANINGNLNTIQFQGIGLSPTNPGVALGGSQDNGTERFTDAAGWTETDGGDGGAVQFSQQNGNIAYRVSPVGSFGPTDFFRASSDGGQTWVSKTTGLNGNDNMDFYPPIAVDPSNGSRVFLGTQHLYQTTNGGTSWTKIGTEGVAGFNPGANPVDAIGVSASTSSTVYAASGGTFAPSSAIYVTTNSGTSWSTISLPSGSGRVNDLEVDPSNSLIVYAVTSTFSTSGSHHVFRSINGGTAWTDITGNLANLPTWTLQIDPTQANTLYVGNDGGVFVTHNLGTTWSALGSGLPNAQVFQLVLNTTYSTLAAGTHGRGLWEILTLADAPTNVTSTNANGTYGAGASLTITIQFSSAVTVTGTPTLALNSGGSATYASGSGTNLLSFTYVVGSTDNSSRLDYVSTGSLALSGGTIKDANGNIASLTLPAPGGAGSLGLNKNIVITTADSVSNVTATNANGTYSAGATLTITVTFAAAVNVTGTPQLALNSGGTASYSSGTGTTTLSFSYTVAANDYSALLDYVSTTSLTLNGGTIKDTGGTAANLTLPAPGSAGSLGANKSIIVFTADTVTNVTSTTANGTYAAGSTITITVTFSRAVTVTGTPQLALNSGGTANYSSGTGSTTLSFAYVIAGGDYSPLLDYVATTSLTLNGGTIKDGNSNAATLTLAAPGSAGSLSANKSLVIFTPDTVTNISSTKANGTYGAGTAITITIDFSRAVTVTGTPQLALNSGGTASYSSGTGTSTLSFAYTVAATDYSALLDYVSTTSLSLNGGTIKDGNSNSATLTLPAPGSAGSLGANKSLVIFTPDTVTNVSSTKANGTYGAGTSITITVDFSRAVTVTGTPQLALNSGGTASYSSGTGTSTLSFAYTVAATDYSALLDYVSTSSLSLNGGTIKDSNNNAATLTLVAPGSAGSLGANKNIVIFTPDTVTNVSSTKANGTYGAGTAITITVDFARAVTVTGTPQLALNSGGTASYSSGTGTTTLSFSYTVAATDYSPLLDYVATTSLSLNGGTIKDGNSNAATLTLPAPGSAGSLSANKSLVIFTADTVTNVTSTNANATYAAGATITITVTFSRAVTVTGTPQLALNSGGTASYSSGTGTTTLSFSYTVAATDYSPLLDYVSTTSLSLNGGTIKDSNSNAATLTLAAPGSAGSLSANKSLVIFTPDTVTNVTSTNANATYAAGATITITVTFSRAVTVTGTPQLALNSGGTASYSSGTGTSALSFAYTVAATDYSPLLDYVSTTSLSLNGGTIKDSNSNAATLTLPAPGSAGSLGANKNIVIFTPDTVTNVSSTKANGTYGAGTAITITVDFARAVTVTGTPQLALNSGGTASYSSGTGTTTLSFAYTVAATDYSPLLDYVSTTSLSLNGGTIKDGNSNAATLTLPAPGSAGSLGANKSLVIFTPDTVTNVSSTNANGTYGAGATVTITVDFSRAVTVTGTPQLALNSGGTASYSSGTGTTTLSFSYTVAATDYSPLLDYVATTSLSLNGGTIKDGNGNAATLTLAAPGSAGSLGANKNIVIFTPDTVTNVSSTNANATYAAGATIIITIDFSRAVTVTGTPHLALNSNGTANYSSGSGTSTLSFAYIVGLNDYSPLLDYVATSSLSLNGGTIKDSNSNTATLTLPAPGAAGSLSANKSIAIFTPDTVINVTSTNANATYAAGATITITVAFSQAVTVTGTPLLALNSGGTASYSSGTGTTTLSFSYTVAATDYSPLLDYVSTTSLSLNGGTIKDGNGNAATLTLVAPGSAGSLSANKSLVIFTPDTVTNVSSTNANGTYGAGATITITVDFSRAVTVTGTPQLALNSGGTASYSSGTGTTTLSFSYTVAATDYSPLLDYVATTSLSLNGGTIKDSNGNAATLTLLAPGSAGSLGANKSLVIFTPDTVTNVSSTNANATYAAGATITITVTFSRAVTVTGTPQLALNSGGTASYSSGTGTSTLSFAYTVAATDYSPLLDYVSTTSLSLNGGTIKDSNSNAATLTLPAPGSAGSLSANKSLVIFTPDTVTNVSSTNANGTYGAGATITITVDFSRAVTVTGTPQLALNSGGTASYSSGTGTSTLSFAYTVAATDYSPLLDYVSTTSLSLNGGTIKDSNSNAATLTLPAPGSAGSLSANKSLVIFTPDTVTNVSSTNANGTYGAGATITITVDFSRAVTVTGTPQLALNSGGTASYSSGTGTSTLSFTYTVAATDYSPLLDYVSTTSLSLNGGTIKDGNGNAATLTLAAPGSAGSLSANKSLVIFTPDTVTNVSSTTADGTYGTGATITITVDFSRAVTVTGTPHLTLNSGGTANYSSGSGTSTLTFTYLVNSGDSSPRLDYSATNSLSGTIKDSNNNAATLTLVTPGSAGSLGANKNIVIDAVAPVVLHYYVLFGTQSYDLIGSTRHNLPWKITGIKVVFSKPIASGDVSSLTGLTATVFSGLGTDTLTWTVSPVSLGVFGTSLLGSSAHAIKDAVGNAITTFNENLRVLWGDVNDDGVVSSADVVAILNASRGAYSIFADLNGDGKVDALDAQIARLLIGSKLP